MDDWRIRLVFVNPGPTGLRTRKLSMLDWSCGAFAVGIVGGFGWTEPLPPPLSPVSSVITEPTDEHGWVGDSGCGGECCGVGTDVGLCWCLGVGFLWLMLSVHFRSMFFILAETDDPEEDWDVDEEDSVAVGSGNRLSSISKRSAIFFLNTVFTDGF